MKKEISVAGHIFRVVLPDDSPLWAGMGQYDPFYVESDAPIFELELVEELPTMEKTLYFDQPTEPGETKIVIYRCGEDWYFESSPTSSRPVSMKLWANSDFTLSKLLIACPSESLFAINNALMLQYAFRTAGMNTLEMHASVIENGGKGYLFLAKSGTGKSTHSKMWLRNIPDSHLLNDDNPIVRVLEDGSVRVYGSPWSGKTPCYKNLDYPVGAMVQIVRAPFNKATRLGAINSYAQVYSSSSGIKFDPQMGDALHDTINKVVAGVKCFTLQCLPDADAAKVCYEAVK